MSEALETEYVARLDAYIGKPSEEGLSAAYELGRRAVGEGLGVLDMAGFHREAIERSLTIASEAERLRVASAAADFFNEALSPFEMSFRGYRVANDELRSLNVSLRQQKEAVESANRELESFSYSVSHDLRNPLGRIDGFTELVLDRFRDKLDAQAITYLSYVRSSTQEMLQLINALLGLSRVTRTELERTTVDLSAIAVRVMDGLRQFAKDRKVEVIIPNDVCANGDARLLAVVMENLLGNAWKFTSKRPNARIELGVVQRHGRDVYYVRDNGAGFDMALAAKLFGTFSRLHDASDFEGTGIGLATVQRVIWRHNGDIWAEAEPNAGATFYFTLEGGRRQ